MRTQEQKDQLHNKLLARMNHDFTYHAPKGNQVERYNVIREKARQFALFIVGSCPESRELSTVLTKLDEVVFWSNASIARNE